jgi:hypothetical protein
MLKPIVLVLLLLTVPSFAAKNQTQQPTQTPGFQAPQAQAGAAQTDKTTGERGTESAPFVVKILPPMEVEHEAKKASTDERIATFTELLFVATAVLAGVAVIQTLVFGWQGRQLKRTVDHLAISERAHVSGGANRGTRQPDGADVLVVTINNYGKTPTTIGVVAASVCTRAELAAFPGWQVFEWKGFVFGQVRSQLTDVTFPYEKDKVMVGRIWYRDIFRKRHSVGFVLDTNNLTAVGDQDAYWEEREERTIRPNRQM